MPAKHELYYFFHMNHGKNYVDYYRQQSDESRRIATLTRIGETDEEFQKLAWIKLEQLAMAETRKHNNASAAYTVLTPRVPGSGVFSRACYKVTVG